MAYLVVVNVISVITCVVDKFKAQRGSWRISEKTLFILSFLGGAFGMYLTMRAIRHKTLKRRFMMGLPIVILVQGTIFYLIFV